MEHTREEGIYGEADVYRFYTVEEAEKYEKQCANWLSIVEKFKKIKGKTWLDKQDIRYLLDNEPVYREYTIIGIEDNEAWFDYYWILEDPITKKRKYKVANSKFYENIKN